METLDFKTRDKALYFPPEKPVLIDVPEMLFLQVDGKGDPNEEGGEYKRALELLYALSYAIKMMPKTGFVPQGYFSYVVPPLEGLWWLDTMENADFRDKSRFCFTSMLRQPEFVTEEVFLRAVEAVAKKKPGLCVEKARLTRFYEGLSVQCMHLGSYDDEPATVKKMKAFMAENNLLCDLSDTRKHHEIYLGDPRKMPVEKRKTVLRYPVRLEH